MKEFDIEKVKRENVFTEPEGFFEDMQRKVIAQTVPPKKGKIIKLNWAYTAAAAIALIFGFTIFINSDPAAEATPAVVTTTSAPAQSATYGLSVNSAIDSNANTKDIVQNDLTFEEQNYPKKTTKEAVIAKPQTANFASKKENIKPQTSELQVDQILASFTSAELADVGKNSEQDIYLDLYN